MSLSGLAEDRLEDTPSNTWLPKVLVVLGLLALLAGGWWLLSHMSAGDGGSRRQVSKISILPDTPPPPPPPPKEEKKPEPPKDEPKQQVHEEQIKQAEAPKAPPEQLKMEGQAGDGASAFGSGKVDKEYSGGPTGPGGGAGSGTSSDRALERFFATSAQRLLRDEIERRLKGEGEQLVASFAIWVGKGGEIERYELTPSGNDGNDRALRAALDETARQFKLPPPPAITQPMRFRLSVKPQQG